MVINSTPKGWLVHGLFIIYDTDLTDEHWSMVARYIPAAKAGGRPREVDVRSILNAVMFVVKTGCHWRLLPKDFPKWQNVYRYYAEWRARGVYRKLHAALHALVRVGEGRKPSPTLAVVDTQSIKTGKYAATHTRGFDGGKKVKGRKRVLVVDSLGLMIDAAVVPANTHDTKAAQKVFAKIKRKKHRAAKTIKAVFADKGFLGSTLSGWLKAQMSATIHVTANLTRTMKQFIPAKKRWVVERSFAWMGDYYRLSVDRERQSRNSLAMIRLASIRLMLRRLYPVEPLKWERTAILE